MTSRPQRPFVPVDGFYGEGYDQPPKPGLCVAEVGGEGTWRQCSYKPLSEEHQFCKRHQAQQDKYNAWLKEKREELKAAEAAKGEQAR